MKIYLAGGETWFQSFIDAGIRNQLYSYYYLRTMRTKAFDKLMEVVLAEKERRVAQGEKPLRLFLDSGGFTYLTHPGTKPDPRVYWKDFLAFVQRTRGFWDIVAELDIEDHHSDQDVGVSLEQVNDWRSELYEAVEGQSYVLPVWHEWRPVADWTAYCADPRFEYLALSSAMGLGLKNKMVGEAHRAKRQVHGFAETKMMTEMKYLKCDSVDSTTWLRATKYGGLFIFHGNQLRVLDHKHKNDRKLFRAYFKANGIDMQKILAEDQKELTKCSLIAWRNMSARFELIDERKDSDVANERQRAGHSAGDVASQGQGTLGEDTARGRPQGYVRRRGQQQLSGDGHNDDGKEVVQMEADSRLPYARQRVAAGEAERDVGRVLGEPVSSGCREDEYVDEGPGHRESSEPKLPPGDTMKIRLLGPHSAQCKAPVAAPQIVTQSNQKIEGKLPTKGGWAQLPDPEDPTTWEDKSGFALCIRARPHVGRTKHKWSDHEVRSIKKIGMRFGCWTCGTFEPGTPKGNFVCDHYPFVSDEEQHKHKAKHGEYQKQVLIPQCLDCSNSQGGTVMAQRGSIHAKKIFVREPGAMAKAKAQIQQETPRPRAREPQPATPSPTLKFGRRKLDNEAVAKTAGVDVASVAPKDKSTCLILPGEHPSCICKADRDNFSLNIDCPIITHSHMAWLDLRRSRGLSTEIEGGIYAQDMGGAAVHTTGSGVRVLDVADNSAKQDTLSTPECLTCGRPLSMFVGNGTMYWCCHNEACGQKEFLVCYVCRQPTYSSGKCKGNCRTYEASKDISEEYLLRGDGHANGCKKDCAGCEGLEKCEDPHLCPHCFYVTYSPFRDTAVFRIAQRRSVKGGVGDVSSGLPGSGKSSCRDDGSSAANVLPTDTSMWSYKQGQQESAKDVNTSAPKEGEAVSSFTYEKDSRGNITHVEGVTILGAAQNVNTAVSEVFAPRGDGHANGCREDCSGCTCPVVSHDPSDVCQHCFYLDPPPYMGEPGGNSKAASSPKMMTVGPKGKGLEGLGEETGTRTSSTTSMSEAARVPGTSPESQGLSVVGSTGGQSGLIKTRPTEGPMIASHPMYIEEEQKKVREGLPGLGCSNCAISGECPEYQEGAGCFFEPMFKLLPVRDLDAHLAHIENLLEWDKERTYRSLLSERLTAGGQIDPRVSAQLDQHIQRLLQFKQLATKNTGPKVPMGSASLTARGPSIMERLFGGSMPAGHAAVNEIPLNEPGSTPRSAPTQVNDMEVLPRAAQSAPNDEVTITVSGPIGGGES